MGISNQCILEGKFSSNRIFFTNPPQKSNNGYKPCIYICGTDSSNLHTDSDEPIYVKILLQNKTLRIGDLYLQRHFR
jgi:hypothetical protein